MTLKYVGPKPLFSATGIDFDHAKEDKFIYLSIVAELIQALDHEYLQGKRYSALTGQKPMNPDAILTIIRQHAPDLEAEAEKWEKQAREEVEEDIGRAQENKLLCDEECQVLIKNIEILRNYRIQRSINKSVYYAGIKALAHIIKQGHIDFITAPMFPVFTHVFHSIQGAMKALHPPLDSAIDIYTESGHLFVQLKIQHPLK